MAEVSAPRAIRRLPSNHDTRRRERIAARRSSWATARSMNVWSARMRARAVGEAMAIVGLRRTARNRAERAELSWNPSLARTRTRARRAAKAALGRRALPRSGPRWIVSQERPSFTE